MIEFSDLRDAIDRVLTARAGEPEGIVCSELVAPARVFAFSTTNGVYLVIHPAVLEAIVGTAADVAASSVTALFGIPILDRLPEDAMPLERDWW
jgi:hypothetical protein